jgi:hypothetical protein
LKTIGHSSFKTTSDCYSHLEAKSKEKAGKILEEILGGGNDNEEGEE